MNEVCSSCQTPLRQVYLHGQPSDKYICIKCDSSGGKCPLCGNTLRSTTAQQCRNCKGSWHAREAVTPLKEKPLALSFLETKFPGSHIEHFGICYTGIVNRQTALKSLAQDLMAVAVVGFPGMILFGSQPDYYASIELIGLQKGNLILCEMGFVPAEGCKDNIQVHYDNVAEMIKMAMKEPEKIKSCTAALKDLKFSGPAGNTIWIKGALARELTLLYCPDTGALTSPKDAILAFEGLSGFPKPEELLMMLQKGNIDLTDQKIEKYIFNMGYSRLLKGYFSDLNKTQRVAIFSRMHQFPTPIRLFFGNWCKENDRRLRIMLPMTIISTLLSIATVIYLVNGFIYHSDEPTSFLGLLGFIFVFPLLILTFLFWFCIANYAWYARWHKSWAMSGAVRR
jgi:hypothetical protein